MERALRIIEKSIYIGLYLFLGVFFVQLFRGLYMELIPWKYELDPPGVVIMEFGGVYLLSIFILLLANTFFVGLNTFRLALVCAATSFAYTYIFRSFPNSIFTTLLLTTKFPQNIILAINIFMPMVVGYTLNKAIKPTPKATRYFLHSLRSLLQKIDLRFRLGL